MTILAQIKDNNNNNNNNNNKLSALTVKHSHHVYLK
jgi:hypothetical protein